jgi:fluoroquinolone resistance protein
MFFKKKPFEFTDIDYSMKDFNDSTFSDGLFRNCLFYKTILEHSRIQGKVDFENCTFRNINFINTNFGSNNGHYLNCDFDRCNFKGRLFNFTRFVNCTFKICKLVNIDFSGSSFQNCKFIGKLENVSFNGIYDTNKSPFPTFESVDFSEAIFGEFVTFYDCDVSTCIPPKNELFDDLLYHLYENNTRILSTGSKDRIVIKHSPAPI